MMPVVGTDSVGLVRVTTVRSAIMLVTTPAGMLDDGMPVTAYTVNGADDGVQLTVLDLGATVARCGCRCAATVSSTSRSVCPRHATTLRRPTLTSGQRSGATPTALAVRGSPSTG